MLLRQTLRATLAPCLSAAAAAIAQPAPPTAAPAASAPPPAAAASAPVRAASAPGRAASGPGRSASAPGRPASAPPRAAPAAANEPGQRIEITGGRESDTEQRRQSTAAKIVIGREEIDKYGDASVGEVLRRLPGVTTPGAPGRGGPPRLRGLGNGFTQLLIDGQRIPPGFSLESLTPEQVERIEILRAPTAETGARAIAGTINIVTREGFKRRLNDLRVGVGLENGRASPNLNWTHNDSAGDLTYNVSGTAFNPHRKNTGDTRTTVSDLASGTLLEDRSQQTTTTENRIGLNLTSRLQWRLGAPAGGAEGGGGDVFALTPSIFHTEAKSDSVFDVSKPLARPPITPLFDYGNSHTDSSFTNARLNGQWRQRVGDVRLELNGGGGSFRSTNDTLRNEFQRTGSGTLRVTEQHSRSGEDSLTLNLKGSGVAGGNEQGGEHSLVSGLEIDTARRSDSSTSLQNGVNLLANFGDNLQADSLRLAAFVQDDWNLSPSWALNAGLRWETIHTQGDNGSGTRPTNRSTVTTPLFNAVWKPDPKSRDQVRLSLSRSYRSPALGTLIARPSINRDFDPQTGSNTILSPDSAGNPNLKPELATGLDLAFERYLEGGGILSANLFHRNIQDLMRGVTTLETVSYSPFPRYVRRMQNIGDATTTGVELDGKFRLDQLITGSPGVELRANLSVFDSKVKAVPGPDNRLDQQSKASANLGADYRLRGTPLTLGGNVNWVPGYTTRIDVGQRVTVSTKQVWDAFALWTFSPTVALRLLGNNLLPRDYANTTIDDAPGLAGPERTTVRSNGPSYINWQLRLELKL
jgi:iron complex outermembrane receptor protein